MIRLGSAGKMGKGVFATELITPNQLIMSCHSLEIDKDDVDHVLETRIHHHWFEHPWKKTGGLFVLGLISMLNHSKKPNVRIEFDKTSHGYIANCIALATIAPRTQLFMDYGPGTLSFD